MQIRGLVPTFYAADTQMGGLAAGVVIQGLSRQRSSAPGGAAGAAKAAPDTSTLRRCVHKPPQHVYSAN